MVTVERTDTVVETPADRADRGRAVRRVSPRRNLAALHLPSDRPDPVELLEGQAATRIPELVPIRYGRMLTSPFAFYRGAALLMASDLAAGPRSGLTVQLCGDAHLSNFGVFGSAERRLVFDLNDFDETLPGPFEWDVKRLAASLEIAGRSVGFTTAQRRTVVTEMGRAYREAMRDFAQQTNLAVWYSRADMDDLFERLGPKLTKKMRSRTEKQLAKARTRDSMQVLGKLTTSVDGQPRIMSAPPLVVPVEELFPEHEAEELYSQLQGLLAGYRSTLAADRRHLLGQYRLVHLARKVVGVGSVGTRAWILLLLGRDGDDPLFLQAKEAEASVLERFLGASAHAHHGERVVQGQRLMQASSDIFLGWERVTGPDGGRTDFYLRQLRDWKASAEPEVMVPEGMVVYGRICGWTLARAHARSGDRIAIASYLGSSTSFDEAIADFAVDYADQNDRDFAAVGEAVASGRIEAVSDG
ncbi:MAG TPA: DUF2252 domain-containing protein [Nocardioides sp.]|nr:DUF2252 domain-containing protein [Nocardioides sp.]